MRMAKPTLRDSFFGWLGVSAAPSGPDPRQRQQLIRERMLHELMRDAQASASRLAGRISVAHDVETLWYLRSELMQTLCRARGEAGARAAITQITELFEGLLPSSMMPGQRPRRPSRVQPAH